MYMLYRCVCIYVIYKCICNIYIYIYMRVCTYFFADYLCEVLFKVNVVTDKGNGQNET